ncbi:hypothetical protein COV18_03170 [Candidatus Woesearchaeota archaeon CG10_big_fil_rev_8_21_14_0_10_37_12]|nr:MAG: hypothetical protein COV18_03170 [Candidatus Woesearchaeota archaeon CG10_big_fil_rev_8_21_14_0_10_37_12]
MSFIFRTKTLEQRLLPELETLDDLRPVAILSPEDAALYSHRDGPLEKARKGYKSLKHLMRFTRQRSEFRFDPFKHGQRYWQVQPCGEDSFLKDGLVSCRMIGALAYIATHPLITVQSSLYMLGEPNYKRDY